MVNYYKGRYSGSRFLRILIYIDEEAARFPVEARDEEFNRIKDRYVLLYVRNIFIVAEEYNEYHYGIRN